MGDTYLVGLIGDGVIPSLTPSMHMQEAQAQGLAYLYRPIDLPSINLTADAVGDLLCWGRRLGYTGFNITHPCKQSVMQYLDRVDARAAALGAVNTVVFEGGESVGYNTDVTGYAAGFKRGLSQAVRRHVVQVGAGGAGSAVSDALLGLGVERLSILDLDAERARGLAAALQARFPQTAVEGLALAAAADVVPRADGLVNCTPMGMADHPGMAVAPDLLRSDLWVSDIVYRPFETELLRFARRVGAPTLHGGYMAVYQAVYAFELFTQRPANADRMLAHFTELVA